MPQCPGRRRCTRSRKPRLLPRRRSSSVQRQQQARARHAERMAERDRAAVDVDLLAIQAELLLDGEVLRRERFVDFDQVDVGEREAGASPARRAIAGAGPMPMIAGSTPTVAHAGEPADRLRGRAPSRPSRDARISAAPPSTMPLALPAVTVPSFENAVGSLASPSIVVSGRM